MAAFQLRVMATARIAGYVTIDADTEELAIEQAKKLDVDSVVFQVDDDFYIEGDPIGFLQPEYDGTPETENAEPIELDLRADGEPLSWNACQIVKDLAQLANNGNPSTFVADMLALARRAQAACSKETVDG